MNSIKIKLNVYKTHVDDDRSASATIQQCFEMKRSHRRRRRRVQQQRKSPAHKKTGHDKCLQMLRSFDAVLFFV